MPTHFHSHPHTPIDRPKRVRQPGEPLRIGVGGPVGSGKTALVAALCRHPLMLGVELEAFFRQSDRRLRNLFPSLRAELPQNQIEPRDDRRHRDRPRTVIIRLRVGGHQPFAKRERGA